MKKSTRSWFNPVGWILILAKKWSRFLFDRGVWKSVVFEIPVLNFHTLMDAPTPLGILVILKALLDDSGIGTVVVLDQKQMRQSDLSIKPNKSLSNISEVDSKLEDNYYAHNLALGISELTLIKEELGCVILGHQPFVGLIRAQANIVVMNFQNPVFQEDVWPIGDRTELMVNMELTDFMVLYNVPKEMDLVTAREWFNTQMLDKCEFGVIYEDETPRIEDIIADNGIDQFKNIQDRDTFEKSLIRIVEQYL